MVEPVSAMFNQKRTNMANVYFIARDKDGSLWKYPYWEGMTATDIPHRHVNVYPFDGNYYVQGAYYQPKKGKRIEDNGSYGFVTYDNSPVKIIESFTDLF